MKESMYIGLYNKKLLILIVCLIMLSFYVTRNSYASIAFEKINNIEQSIWTIPTIRWPRTEKGITVYYQPINMNNCNKLKVFSKQFFELEGNDVWLGKVCERFIVLIRYPTLINTKNFRKYVSAHESFHIAAQIFGMPFMAQNSTVPSSPDYKEFNRLVRKTINSKVPYETCQELTSYLDNLPQNTRDFLIWRASLEWPAEFYSKEVVFGSNDKEYYTFQMSVYEKISIENKDAIRVFYNNAIDVVNSLEKKLSRKTWQYEVNQGNSIFDLFLKVNNCKTYTENKRRWEVSSYGGLD